MNYEGQICRGPMERSSFKLPIAVGCSYNACRFCTLFKHLKHRELPVEQIEAELLRVKDANGMPPSIFLGDGNAFGTNLRRLMKILDLIHRNFPKCKAINMDATITDIGEKSDEELKLLYEAGVRHLYIGIESGLDDILTFMNKDHNLQEAYEQVSRMKAAGLVFDAHIMTGVAGKGRGLENAEKISEFFNVTKPERIVNFSMFLHRQAPLYQEIIEGNFSPADELENLVEERHLLELIKTKSLEYDGFHDFIEFRVKGVLPEDRNKMILKLDQKIAECEEIKEQIIAVVD